MVYSSFRFKYQSLIALLNANLLSISTLFCVHPEFLVILIKNLKVMFLILYCSIFKELCAALATAYLLYHIHSSLSSTFLKFFKFLFSEFWTFYRSVTVLPPFLPSVFSVHLRTLDCHLSHCSSGFRLSQVPSVFVPSRLSACLLYHGKRHLSTFFSK